MKLKFLINVMSLSLILFACKKGVEPVDGSNASVELKSGTKNVTGDITVNPKDSIFFDFTISSDVDMGFVGVQKNPVNQTAFLQRDTIKNSSFKNKYSTVMKFRADSANGSYVYRIVAHTKNGVYIGHKDIVVTTSNDMLYFTDRLLYAPDSVLKVNKNFYAAPTGQTFSFAEGASISSQVDFGYFYDTSKTGTTVNGHTIYALNSTGLSTLFNFSTWTKNTTIFKKLTSGTPNPTFAQALSAGTLRTAGATQLASGTTTKVTGLTTTSPNNTVYFKTASGKFGMIQILVANTTTNAGGGVDPNNTFIKLDVKIEK